MMTGINELPLIESRGVAARNSQHPDGLPLSLA